MFTAVKDFQHAIALSMVDDQFTILWFKEEDEHARVARTLSMIESSIES